MRSFSDIPVLIGAALAGFLIGLCLETTRPLGWACGVGIFVATCNWSATTWHIKPSFSDLALQGASAAASGALAFVASWMTERRRTSRRATEGPA